MLSPVISQALCLPAEALVNRILRQDPAALARFSRAEGRILALDIHNKACINVRLLSDGFTLSMTAGTPADVTLRGELRDFIALARATDKANELINSAIDMEGDTELALSVTRAVQSLDIDWEALIQPATGGLLAHQIGKGIRGLVRWSRDTGGTWSRAGKEYLEDEIQLVTPAPLLDDFSHEVDRIRLATDRLDARIARLENKNTEE